ncbi:HNH endonuclease [Geobacillus thermoleovorans]|uniref:HNH endonuclease n=1 Tax=Geobacillus thermoleovorans TaxID=33941 RepID=A0A2Z3N8J6_GEOTH|nr:HNH endonuclease signature motif containing protein [Geobacillus thermoleovorans]AWO74945.1 HNH endonuclease [Geobacillus thermoleovorans]
MNLSHEFHPAPKPTKQRKDKPKPKLKVKKPKKRKKPQTYKGRVIPSRKARGSVSKREYTRMIEEFGNACLVCGSTYNIEAHHVRFRSQGGRGKWRNLAPLCKIHHQLAHQDRDFADWLRQEREARYGSWYWADEYDLFQAGLIPNTTKEAFEKYMEGEEERARLARVATENHS